MNVTSQRNPKPRELRKRLVAKLGRDKIKGWGGIREIVFFDDYFSHELEFHTRTCTKGDEAIARISRRYDWYMISWDQKGGFETSVDVLFYGMFNAILKTIPSTPEEIVLFKAEIEQFVRDRMGQIAFIQTNEPIIARTISMDQFKMPF